MRDLGGDAIGHGDGVGGGLAGDVEQDGGDAVGGDGVVDGLGAGMYVGHIGDAHGSAAGSGLDDQRGEVGDVMRLRTDQREDELVVGLVETGRFDDVGVLHRIDQVGEGDAGVLQARQVGNNVDPRGPDRPAR